MGESKYSDVFRKRSLYEIYIKECLCVSAVCIQDGSSSVSGGQVNRRLSYKNGVLELKYEGGDVCPANSALKHSTVVQFICRSVT